MAVSLHMFNVKTAYDQFERNLHFSSSPSLSCSLIQLRFIVSKASHSKLYAATGYGCRRRDLKVSCMERLELEEECENQRSEKNVEQLTCVMKFGGSSVSSANRMREIADLILSFPEERPVIVLSAMGKTTNNLLLAGEKAVSCGVTNASEIDELIFIKELHLRTIEELGIDRSVISAHLEELEQLLKGIAMMKEMTLRTKDYLVSFGECMSTRIFASYLNKIGVKACQVC